MDETTKTNFLSKAMIAFGVIFLLVYPIGIAWPSG
jgi:hypothetical protein